MGKFLKEFASKNEETKNKKKIENIVVLVLVLIVTLVIINIIWKGDTNSKNDIKTENYTGSVLANNNQENSETELERKLENILGTIKNVGKVNVLLNYAESSSLVPLYNESTTTSSTEEGDSTGGTRNVTETETKKDVVFSEHSGEKNPVTQKTQMPTIQGAIITAEGASDANVRTNIVNGVCAITGLSIDKIQVFEMQKEF